MSAHGPLVIAHRGDSYRHRENTVPAILAGWALGADLVERMRERGCGISTWTVDSPSNVARLLELGVDAVISNRPAQALAVRNHVRAQRKVLA
jgi:glycerophosphoryl diester phosphodiesterase